MTKLATLARSTAAAALIAAATIAATGDAFADRYNRHVEVVNHSGVTMTRLFVSNSSADYWGADHLGSYVLEPGQSVVMNFDDGSGHCSFDFRGEFTNGASAENYKVDVCTISTFTFY